MKDYRSESRLKLVDFRLSKLLSWYWFGTNFSKIFIDSVPANRKKSLLIGKSQGTLHHGMI